MSDEIMDLLDFPQERVKNMFVLIENKGSKQDELASAFYSELDAFKAYKGLRTNKKKIIHANVILADVHGMKVLCEYEEI